jgi:hypothetical protein
MQNRENGYANVQYGCCISGCLSSLLLCLSSLPLSCAIHIQSNPAIFWSGIGVTATGLTFGSVPIVMYTYNYLFREPQIEHINDDNTDTSSDITAELYYCDLI